MENNMAKEEILKGDIRLKIFMVNAVIISMPTSEKI